METKTKSNWQNLSVSQYSRLQGNRTLTSCELLADDTIIRNNNGNTVVVSSSRNDGLIKGQRLKWNMTLADTMCVTARQQDTEIAFRMFRTVIDQWE